MASACLVGTAITADAVQRTETANSGTEWHGEKAGSIVGATGIGDVRWAYAGTGEGDEGSALVEVGLCCGEHVADVLATAVAGGCGSEQSRGHDACSKVR